MWRVQADAHPLMFEIRQQRCSGRQTRRHGESVPQICRPAKFENPEIKIMSTPELI